MKFLVFVCLAACTAGPSSLVDLQASTVVKVSATSNGGSRQAVVVLESSDGCPAIDAVALLDGVPMTRDAGGPGGSPTGKNIFGGDDPASCANPEFSIDVAPATQSPVIEIHDASATWTVKAALFADDFVRDSQHPNEVYWPSATNIDAASVTYPCDGTYCAQESAKILGLGHTIVGTERVIAVQAHARQDAITCDGPANCFIDRSGAAKLEAP